MEKLIVKSLDYQSVTPGDFVRPFMEKVDWSARLIGIKGARGVGKSTLIRQRLRTEKEGPGIYVTLDDPFFTDNSFEETIEQLRVRGFTHFYLDEVHRLQGWAAVVKSYYDRYPKLYFVFSGSSLLDMHSIGADLSRRSVMYEMPGLSFREYLIVQGLTDAPAYTVEQIFNDHQQISRKIAGDRTLIPHFHAYLKSGYYPYFTEGEQSYHIRLSQSIRTVLESDMNSIEGYDIGNSNILMKLLYILAGSVPYKPNISLLARRTSLHANTVVKYLHFLERAAILSFLWAPNKGMSLLQKPDKVFLENSNLAYALRGNEVNIGSVRELFFHNQVRHVASLYYTTVADFLVNEKYQVEIGGPEKSSAPSKGMYAVRDGIDHGAGHVVPLWLFGFLH